MSRLFAVFAILLLSGGISVDIDDLPPPHVTRSVSNPTARIAAPPDWKPKAAEGYKVEVFAEGLDGPRNLLVAEDEVFVAEQFRDRVISINKKSGERLLCRDGFNQPYGMAFHNGILYVADVEAVWRLEGCGGEPQMVTVEGELGGGSGHSTRNLAFAPNGESFFVAIGSAGNIDIEPIPRATIRRFPSGGGRGETYAEGLRNPVGLAFHPKSGDLWATVVERDRMGDDLVPDYLAPVKKNGFYGWPYYYLGLPQPGFAEKSPYPASRNIIPPVLFRSHSSPLGLAFWRGDAYVALRGSWNSSMPRGFMVVRVPFDEKGSPKNEYHPFLTDFVEASKRGRPLARGRPAAVAVLSDTELLVADDLADTIWKVSKSE